MSGFKILLEARYVVSRNVVFLDALLLGKKNVGISKSFTQFISTFIFPLSRVTEELLAHRPLLYDQNIQWNVI